MGMFQSSFNNLLSKTGSAIEIGAQLKSIPIKEEEKKQKKAEQAKSQAKAAKTQETIENWYKEWKADQTALVEQRANEIVRQKEEVARQHMLAHMQMMRDAKATLRERRKILAEREANK